MIHSSSSSSSIFFFFFFLLFVIDFSLISPSFADDDSRTKPQPGTTSPPAPQRTPNYSPFKPSVAIIVGVLTVMFSITFLILLYAKHCKRGNGDAYGQGHDGGGSGGVLGKRNSGIDKAVIDILPVFRFGSLRGQKEGLECAVCISRFEPNEVLRLLPKCKHAFHVECVDTWLDAHSTCPLCRHRVDPEDIMLIEDCKLLQHDNHQSVSNPQPEKQQDRLSSDRRENETECPIPEIRRVSGRHSSAGEQTSKALLEIVVENPSVVEDTQTKRNRRCRLPPSLRRSLDSCPSTKKKNESSSSSSSTAVDCFDRSQRKDGLLLSSHGSTADKKGSERRFEHRIIVSDGNKSNQRWSDVVRSSDLLYLRSEMIISSSDDNNNNNILLSRRKSEGSSRPPLNNRHQNHQKMQLPLYVSRRKQEQQDNVDNSGGRNVINSRSVSEITGLSRLWNREHQTGGGGGGGGGVVSRWLGRVSSQSHAGVRTERTTTSSIPSSVV